VRPPQFLWRLGLEAALWLSPPAAFLFVYVKHHRAPGEAVGPHLKVVAVAVLALVLVRLGLYVLLKSERLYRLSAACAVAGLATAMLAYYGLVVAGLESWGRVVTWQLIESYSAQIPMLAEAMGIALPAAITLCGLAVVGIYAAAWAFVRHFDWVSFLGPRASPMVLSTALVCGAALCATEAYNFVAAPPTRHWEPLSLTFYPDEAARNLQGHSVDRLSAAKLDAAEDEARAYYEPGRAAERKNVILIVVDGLRPDHMSLYGYARDTTPNLRRLERSGMIRKLSSMRAVCASSACGVLGIIGSKFVHQLSYRPFTLHEALKRHGYRVHLVLSGDHTSFYDLKAVYGDVDSYFDGHGMRKLKHMNDDLPVLERLEQFPAWDGAPVMMQFHLMSAHILGRRDSAFAKFTPFAPYGLLARPAAESSATAVNFYDNGVLQADAVIAALLATLERKGYLGNAVVAITADHGESLGEHGLYQHSNGVREEVLRIPFVLVSYGDKPSRPLTNRRLASQVDIAPTLLAELGMPRPRTWAGRPLQEPAGPQLAYFQELGDVGLFDATEAGSLWKYWISSRSGAEYAFDLSVDPGESDNLVGRLPPDRRREWRLKVLPGAAVHIAPRPTQ
jgi:glucan phosphoethanolaminetransferase (alkaline phosphatase superfamily)